MECTRAGNEPITRLILDGTVLACAADRKATAISLFVMVTARADSRKTSLAIKRIVAKAPRPSRARSDRASCAGRSSIVDAPRGLEAAIAALWDSVPI